MIRFGWFLALAGLLFIPQAQAQTWLARNPVMARAGVYQFVINNVAYVGGGEDDDQAYADLYAYDPTADQWLPRAPLPGSGRAAAAAFVVGGRAYVAGGVTFSDTLPGQHLTEVWMYDPTANQWTARAALPGPGRMGAAGFAIAGTGYVGGGGNFDSGITYPDFYSYNPTANQWTSRAALPLSHTLLGGAFALGAEGYVTGGLQFLPSGAIGIGRQTWRYTPATNQWARRADLPTPQAYGGSLATGGYGYVTEGVSDVGMTLTAARMLLRYDAAANTWTSVAPGQGPGAGRGVPVFFAVQNALYLGGGVDLVNDMLLGDFWRLPGIVTAVAAAVAPAGAFRLTPNPAHGRVRLTQVPASAVTVCDARGRVVHSQAVAMPDTAISLDLAGLAPGLYLVRCGAQAQQLVVE